MATRVLAICLVGLVACADVPDYDDPRQVPVEGDYISCENLLGNGNFDSSPLMWSLSGGDVVQDERQLSSDHPFRADSGYYFAWFGGTQSQTRSASQRFAVPNTPRLKLTGKHFIAAVTTAGVMEDTVKLEIVDDGGRVIAAIAAFSNLDSIPETASFSWKELVTEFTSQPFAGKSVVFRIVSVTDAANNTNFLFDSLQLRPSGCL